jgi:predicted nucleotidyltransferase
MALEFKDLDLREVLDPTARWVVDRTVLFTVHGSRAYGLHTESSDYDYKGVAIPPAKYYHGFLNHFHQAECKEPDICIYDLRKFLQLAADCNPNIVEVLWTDDSDLVICTKFGEWLRGLREKILSQKAKHTFSGYAVSQLKRIRTHRKWLLNPPFKKPVRKEFGLPETTALSKDMMGAIRVVLSSDEPANFSREVMRTYERERSYHNALQEWHQYCNWKKNRNPERAALEAKHGYDCKHAMHLVRLMRMCREILETGKVVVKRPDREELLAIRNGAWGYDQLVEWAELQDKELNDVMRNSSLPHSPDRNFLDDQCQKMVEFALSTNDSIRMMGFADAIHQR